MITDIDKTEKNGNTNMIEEVDIKKCIKHITDLPEENFRIYEHTFADVTDKLVGFLGDYQKGVVKYIVDEEEKASYFFVKSIPKNDIRAKQVRSNNFFYRESNIYSQIFPRFTKRKDDDKFLANCSLVTKSSIFCEDLSIQGYKIANKKESLDDDHCYIALSQIAKFHAESLILEESKSNGYKLIDEFRGILNQVGYKYEGWYLAGVEAGLQAAKTLKIIPKHLNIANFEEKWGEFFKDGLKLCQESIKGKNVLCHRDLWTNNLMFRYNEEGKPIQCVLVDFQACGYMPPAGDVMSFIYLNIMDERRYSKQENYLRHYYNILSTEITKNKHDLNIILPWNEFRKTCDEYKKLALLQCIILHQLSLIDGKYEETLFPNFETYEYLMDVSRSDMILYLIDLDPIYKEKFVFSIIEIINQYL